MHRFTILVTLCAAAGSATAGPLAMKEVVPPRTAAPLPNPGMGIYGSGTTNPKDIPPDAWFAPIVTIGYFRTDWSRLVPEREGEYRFAEYFDPIFDLWVKQWGKRVAFRFMAESMHSREKYVTPKWVFDAGVPGVVHRGLYVDEQIDPVFWDERYLRIQERFIADLGKYLDGRPGLEFIDIGCIGEWGEMHLGQHIPGRWTSEQLAQTGFTPARYIAAYRRVIDAFARAFPRTRVFLNVGAYETINDYAALRGIHFRQDGLTPSGPSANVGKLYYHPYSRRGVICNYEFHSSYRTMKEKGWGVRETFEKGLEDPISYLHINLMSYSALKQAPDEVKEAVTGAARRIGFRFVPLRVRYNAPVRANGQTAPRLLLEHTWRNEGVAPCYDSYALRWSLLDQTGKTAAEGISFPKRPTSLWWPGEEVALSELVTLPPNLSPGRYRLAVAMVKPEEPALRIYLGIEGRNAEGAYELGEVAVERAAPPQGLAYEEGFETDLAGWRASQGMVARREGDARQGQGCLLVTGLQPGTAWNYASVTLQRPLLPASRYRLSCWMKVEQIEGGEAPYLKIGLTDAEGKWLENHPTTSYDLKKLGTWQLLQGYVETTPDTAGGHLAIEKGNLGAKARITLRLDDVRLELLESP
ncbi:MAG: DUF4832 domain-containing protein [Armatimonadota bacterium]|nr:DUF4832 domain-containing protein [Armatimonadota bacterium]